MNIQQSHEQQLRGKSTQIGDDQMQETKRNSVQTVYAGLGSLDRLLVFWIFRAIIVGILLGNVVDSVGPALQRGNSLMFLFLYVSKTEQPSMGRSEPDQRTVVDF